MSHPLNDLIDQIRALGCAVCVFQPSEFVGVEAGKVEAAMCEAGTEAIECLVPRPRTAHDARSALVKALIDDGMEAARNDSNCVYEMLMSGIKGFASMSDDELVDMADGLIANDDRLAVAARLLLGA